MKEKIYRGKKMLFNNCLCFIIKIEILNINWKNYDKLIFKMWEKFT